MATSLVVGACSSFGAAVDDRDPVDAAPGSSDGSVDPDGAAAADGPAGPLGDGGVTDGRAKDAGRPPDAAVYVANGHAYDVVVRSGGIKWSVADVEATGRGGYLATITSQGELDFVWALIQTVPEVYYQDGDNYFGPLIGGRQRPDGVEPAGGWEWVTKEPWSFTAWWTATEPNNDTAASGGLDEDCVQFYSFSSKQPKWADIADVDKARGYVIEWD